MTEATFTKRDVEEIVYASRKLETAAAKMQTAETDAEIAAAHGAMVMALKTVADVQEAHNCPGLLWSNPREAMKSHEADAIYFGDKADRAEGHVIAYA